VLQGISAHDVVERAEDVLDLVLRTLRGTIKPVMSL
jgi:microcystin degradation protein MlrC